MQEIKRHQRVHHIPFSLPDGHMASVIITEVPPKPSCFPQKAKSAWICESYFLLNTDFRTFWDKQTVEDMEFHANCLNNIKGIFKLIMYSPSSCSKLVLMYFFLLTIKYVLKNIGNQTVAGPHCMEKNMMEVNVNQQIRVSKWQNFLFLGWSIPFKQ